MSILKRTICLIIALAMCFCFIACDDEPTSSSVNGGGQSSSVERPDIEEPPVFGGYIEYPDAPAAKPTVVAGEIPSIGEAVSYGKYVVENTDKGISATWENVGDWEYIYFPVNNYNPEYCNVKITVTTKGAERIAIQALYWEMYEMARRPVTIFRGDLVDGEQYLVAEFGKCSQLNEEYQPLNKQPLKDALIIGFVVLIDSNPVQNAVADKNGSAEFKSFRFLQDGDPELDDKYVIPKVNWSGAFSSVGGYNVTPLEDGGVSIDYTNIGKYAMAYLPIANFSADYCEFEIKLTTQGVKQYSIGVMFSKEGHDNWQDYVEMVKISNATDGEHSHAVNFDGTGPIDTSNNWQYVPGEYIKNYGVYQIVLWFDSLDSRPAGDDYSGTAIIEEVTFTRTTTEGCVVGKAWSANFDGIAIGNDTMAGGSGTITYPYYTGWYKLSMPISGYEPKSKLEIKMLSADPIDKLGVDLNVNGTDLVIFSCYSDFVETSNGVDASGTDATGVTYKIKIEKAGNDENGNELKMYTISFDFTNAKKGLVSGIAFWEKSITSIGFFLNIPDNSVEAWKGTRTIKFVSVQFAD